MDNKNKIPQDILQRLYDKGINEADIVFSMKSDIDRDFIYCDVWCIVTKEVLAVLSGKNGVSFIRGRLFSKKAELEYQEYSYDEYELCDISDISCRKNISSGELCADICGERTSLFRFSMSLQNKAYHFCDMLSKLCRNEELTEEDFKENDDELCCPNCGMRYTDPKRKICPKCMNKAKLLKRLSVFFMRYKLYMLITVLSLVATTVLAAIVPYIKGSVLVDDVLEAGGTAGELLKVVLLIVATKLLSVIASSLNGIISARISARVTYDIKNTVFGAISKLSYGFFTSRQTGGLMTSVNADANSIYNFFCDGLPYLVINIVQFITIFVIMLGINYKLTLVAMITVPVFVALYRTVLFLFDKLYAKNYSKRRSFNSTVTDVLSGFRVVKAFAKEEDETRRFDMKSEAFAQSHKKIGTLNSSLFPLIYFTLSIGGFIVWGYGGWLVIKGKLSVGLLMTFTGYMAMLYEPLSFFSSVSRWWAECMNSIQRVFEILDSIPDVEESKTPVPLGQVKGDVEFSHVSFGYDKTRKILEDIDFAVSAGETIGIVGETGAGKSTLVNLLMRLYDVDEGAVYIDGVDVRDISFEELHGSVAIVSQETFIFSGTIMENIRYAKPDATNAEVFAAAKAADAHSFIIKTPDGYETRVGKGARSLSGGECQRISIARAILKNPKILILDEATSAMDTATERHIQNAVTKLSRGRTTIMIAHRLSTLRDADRIVVIENGRMPELGTHKELLAQKGVYHNLYRLQAEALKTMGIGE